MKYHLFAFPLLMALLITAPPLSAQSSSAAQIFNRRCAVCHVAQSDTRAPSMDALHEMSRASIVSALETGVMKIQGAGLTKEQRVALARYLSRSNVKTSKLRSGFCASPNRAFKDAPGWNSWGVSVWNTRFVPSAVAHLDRAEIPKLKLKWAFGFPGAAATFGQPTVAGGRIFVGSEDGTVYSLDAKTGCVHWLFKAPATVKTAITISPSGIVYFGDLGGNVYALRAATGRLIWKKRVDPHPAACITGSPALYRGKLYVPVSSGEEGAAIDPHYQCCTFRGSLVALDALDGRQIWKTYAIPDPPHRLGRRNSGGAEMWGPSGAAVWSPPTLDPTRGRIYIATGNAYSEPVSPYTDAVLALKLSSGRILWRHQFTEKDVWNSACVAPTTANCPKSPGEDYDFGAPPILQVLANGRRILIAAQKSGVVYGLDPVNGRALWSTRIGKGGPLGGVEWGGAADKSHVYVPLSDWSPTDPSKGGGLFALSLISGKPAWYAPPVKPACLKQTGCDAAQMAPATAIPGVVFSGSDDGHLRAYDARTGKVIWDFDTLKEFKTTDGVEAHGGSMNGAGPTIAGGMLYVNAGYTNGIAGNVLLAFAPSP